MRSTSLSKTTASAASVQRVLACKLSRYDVPLRPSTRACFASRTRKYVCSAKVKLSASAPVLSTSKSMRSAPASLSERRRRSAKECGHDARVSSLSLRPSSTNAPCGDAPPLASSAHACRRHGDRRLVSDAAHQQNCQAAHRVPGEPVLPERAKVAELRPADRHAATNGLRRLEDRLRADTASVRRHWRASQRAARLLADEQQLVATGVAPRRHVRAVLVHLARGRGHGAQHTRTTSRDRSRCTTRTSAL